MKTIKPIIIDGVSHYDEFTTILGGAFTSTPAPVCGQFPEGRVYLVTLSGYVNGWFETATRHFAHMQKRINFSVRQDGLRVL